MIPRLFVCSIIVVPLLAAENLADAQPIINEGLRLSVLRTIFPGMDISAVAAKKTDGSWPVNLKPGEPSLFFPDAMKDEKVYKIVGKAMNAAEKGASGSVLDDSFSDTREVCLKLFHWPGEFASGLLAILQYRFPDANPPMSMLSLGMLAHVIDVGPRARAKDEYLLDTTHHGGIESIRVADLNGDGVANFSWNRTGAALAPSAAAY